MPSYYVDATGGNDGDTGLSPGAAWQTIGHVNGEAFVAGDFILFKRGETWPGTTLTIPSSGAAGNPITFADYDSGAKPIIDGNDAVNCTTISQDYITFSNIRVIDGLDFGFFCTGTSSYITLTDCEADGCGNDNVIFIDGAHHCTVTNLVSTNPYERVIGPAITCLEIADGSHDITITNLTLMGSAGYGISIHAHTLEQFPYNITVSEGSISSNAIHGVHMWLGLNSTLPPSPSILIRDCMIENNTRSGIVLNVLGGGLTYPDNVSLVRNTVRNNYATGAGFAVEIRGDNHYLERNLIKATTERGLAIENTANLTLYNNTVYVPTGVAFKAVLAISGTLAGLVARNNIWATNVGGVGIIEDTVGVIPANADMDYNLHYTPAGAGANRWKWNAGGFSTYANWQANSGQDANSPAPADPIFQEPAADNFHLDHGSPALQVGSPITGMPFYGAAPDCGRWEMRWKSQRTEQELRPMWKFV